MCLADGRQEQARTEGHEIRFIYIIHTLHGLQKTNDSFTNILVSQGMKKQCIMGRRADGHVALQINNGSLRKLNFRNCSFTYWVLAVLLVNSQYFLT